MSRRALRKALMESGGGVCNHCGDPGDDTDQGKLTVDRIEAGGEYSLENCQLLCRSCNSSKHDKPDDVRPVAFARGVMAGGFTAVPNSVLLNANLSMAARMVWATLASYAYAKEECWPGQARLAADLGLSERKLRDVTHELIDAELIRVRQRGRGQTNVYRLLDPRPASGADQEARPADGAGLDRQVVPPKNKETEEGKEGEVKTSPQKPAEVDQVWARYVAAMKPRRVLVDPESRRLILDALKVASVEECCRAIDGCHASAFHMGDNDRSKKYNALSQILKGKRGGRTTREQIDFFLEIAERTGVGAGVTSADPAKVRREQVNVRTGLAPGASEHLRNRGKEAADWLLQHGINVVDDGRGGVRFVPQTGGTTE